METCKTRLQAGICKLRHQVQPRSIGISVEESVRPSQSVEPNLPTKKIGRDKDKSPDTKEGSDEVGSWRTQDQDPRMV